MPESRVVEIVTRIIDRREAEHDAKMKAYIAETVRETLMQIGIDTREPAKFQRNFAHLSSWTDLTRSAGRAMVMVIVTTIAAGTIALIGKALFHGG